MNDPMIEWIRVALPIALGSSFAIFGVIFAVPQIYRGYTRALQGGLRRAAPHVWKPASVEGLARIEAAAQQRSEVSMRLPPVVLPALGAIMIASGIVGALGLVDIGTLICAFFALFCVLLGWYAMRTRASQGERRAALLHRRVFPAWFNPLFPAIPLLQIPLVILTSREGKAIDAAIISASILLGTAATYIYARYSDRALFGADPGTESMVDDDLRGTIAVFFSFFNALGPAVYIAMRFLALGPRSGGTIWFEAILLWAFAAISGRMLKKRKQAILQRSLDSLGRDVVA
ncbi:MAG: hypothetical protein WB491_04865 [Candidatus Aquilonibacter sp.]